MTKIQRVYGKGRYDGIIIGLVFAAIALVLYSIIKSNQKPVESISY